MPFIYYLLLYLYLQYYLSNIISPVTFFYLLIFERQAEVGNRSWKRFGLLA